MFVSLKNNSIQNTNAIFLGWQDKILQMDVSRTQWYF